MASPVPWLLHQTYKSHDIPDKWKAHHESWDHFGDPWEKRFYLDEDLRNVVKNHFPQHLSLYDSFSRTIERVDFARYAILYVYGGVYADLDMEQKASFRPLMMSDKALLASEPTYHSMFLYKRSFVLCNACMVSPPGNPLWKSFMNHIAAGYQPGKNPVFTTGPMALTTHIEQVQQDGLTFTVDGVERYLWDHMTILPTCSFYSQLWNGGSAMGCREGATIYAVHHWTNDWAPQYVPDPIVKAFKWTARQWKLMALFLSAAVVVSLTVAFVAVSKNCRRVCPRK